MLTTRKLKAIRTIFLTLVIGVIVAVSITHYLLGSDSDFIVIVGWVLILATCLTCKDIMSDAISCIMEKETKDE